MIGYTKKPRLTYGNNVWACRLFTDKAHYFGFGGTPEEAFFGMVKC